jgi:hypothetical protein
VGQTTAVPKIAFVKPVSSFVSHQLVTVVTCASQNQNRPKPPIRKLPSATLSKNLLYVKINRQPNFVISYQAVGSRILQCSPNVGRDKILFSFRSKVLGYCSLRVGCDHRTSQFTAFSNTYSLLVLIAPSVFLVGARRRNFANCIQLFAKTHKIQKCLNPGYRLGAS